MKMRHLVALIVLVCATLLSSHPALAQFLQQGPKLVGTGAVDPAYQGTSVSLSADGNTAIVGGLSDNSNAGAARVFAASAPAGSWVLPSSAFRGGLNGAEFHTDVRILNLGTSPVTVIATLYDQASGTTVPAPGFPVAGRSQASFDNVLQSLFGKTLASGSYGPIRFDSTGPIIVSSSVNNVNACGTGATSGQWLPGIDATKAMTAGLIAQLAVSSNGATGYRTNLVVMNPGTTSVTTTMKVRTGGGALLSSGTIGPLEANGFSQVPLDSADTFPGVAGRTDTNLWVEFTSDQPVLAFASVINNASGDPFAVVATPDAGGGASGSWVLPSSAFRGGLNGAEFHTDVRILNLGTSPVTVIATLYDQASGTTVPAPGFPVAGRSQASFDNVLQSLFGKTLASGSYGPIRFDSTGPIIVSSSVNNVNACGTGATSGQWLPGIDATKAMTAGLIAQLAVSASASAGYRTNLVVMNPGSANATATVKLRAGGGVLLSSGTIGPLEANGFSQVPLDSAGTFPGVAGRTDTNLWVEFTSDQPVLAFASVINNASGDPFAVVATPDATVIPVSHSLSGAVSGDTLSGVTITVTGTATASATTDSSGNYSVTGVYDGSYTMTPSKTGYTFTPSSLAVTVSGVAVTGKNFVAKSYGASTYSISGAVSGAVQSGVTVTLSGVGSATTISNGSGNYTFTGLVNGSYTITPSLTGYTFSPANATANVSGGNIVGKDFVATAIPAPYSQADLTGTWHGTMLRAGSINGWMRFTTTLDSSGFWSSASVLDSAGNSYPLPANSIQWTINGSGVISESGINGSPETHMTMTSNKNFIAGTGSNDGSQLGILQKVVPGTVYSNADIQNKSFVYHSLWSGSTNGSSAWIYGAGTTDTVGNTTISSQTNSSGSSNSEINELRGTFVVDGNGNVTLIGNSFIHGFMSDDKKTIVVTDTGGDGSVAIYIIQITGQTYPAGPIPAGIWASYMLAVGSTPAPFWLHSTATVASGGVITISDWVSSNSGITNPGTTRHSSISASGTVTITETPTYHGQVSDDGKFTMATETVGSGVYSLQVNTK